MNVVRSTSILALALLSACLCGTARAQDAPNDGSIVQTSYGCGSQGFCQVHGCDHCRHHHPGRQCPEQGQRLGPALRQAFQPSDQPYFGMQPLFVPRGPVWAERSYPARYPARFPRLRAAMTGPMYMSTQPAEPMNTYTTRSPRDFLHPNPPSIGY